ALDAAGNVYVTGRSFGGSVPTRQDYATVAYDPGGNELWVARYSGPHPCNSGAAIAVDGGGMIYVTGTTGTCGRAPPRGYATVAYDSSGAQLWAALYEDQGFNNARAIAVDGAGTVYVTGSSGGSLLSGSDYATVAYDATSGAQVWVARYAGMGNG